jgi:hypothetical protein
LAAVTKNKQQVMEVRTYMRRTYMSLTSSKYANQEYHEPLLWPGGSIDT